ncbi:hypothetical protein [Ruicaihuangia caeni]|uniref:hypothetical protein n=1 Tax=Ruicaihuangia caeni TaxID=3042517 RepID=UPI00338F1D5C
MARERRRRWPWVVLIALAVVLVPVAVPILTRQSGGSSGQHQSEEQWPLSATALGDDGRERRIDILPAEPGATVDTSALVEGERLVVSGTGYDPSRGIYVAVCKIPPAGEKPGPCLGGVPSTEEGEQFEEGSVQFAPSNWINDDWAWRLFGARSYDDPETGTFTAYIEVPSPVGEGVDCRVDECGLFTRNDHTALNDRVQDLYVPVGFAR